MDKRLAAILSIVITCIVSSGTVILKSCNDFNNKNPENVQVETQYSEEK
jgi:hypothetical protein